MILTELRSGSCPYACACWPTGNAPLSRQYGCHESLTTASVKLTNGGPGGLPVASALIVKSLPSVTWSPLTVVIGCFVVDYISLLFQVS